MLGDAVRGAIVAAVAAAIAMAVVGVVGVPHAVEGGAVAAYLAICVALAFVVAVPAAAIGAVFVLAARAARNALGREHSLAAWVHALSVAAAVYVAAESRTTAWAVARFEEPALTSLLIAVISLAWIGLCVIAAFGVYVALRGRRLLPESRADYDPLQSPRAAVAVWIALGWVAIAILLSSWQRFGFVFPLRPAAAITLALLVSLEGNRIAALLCTERGFPRRATGAALAGLAVASAAVLVWVTDSRARRAAVKSPTLALAVDAVRIASDFDGDGYGWLLGGGDCAPFDSSIHPGASDVPGDGVDQNCARGDYVIGERPSPLPDMPVPAELARDDYSILLITVDTLRYDRTGAGGYRRPTTPNLDALAARGAWFERYYSTGAMTVHVLPTLVASQFTAELPLGERVGGAGPADPRELGGDAVTFMEVFAAAGYRTSMFTAFRFFDGWGVEQGVEHQLNLISDAKPYETAPALTDRAMSHLDRLPRGSRFVSWVHYYEPHYPYVDHPGSPSFGQSDYDRYDGEIRFVDAQIGRWIEWLDSDPERRDRTIVVVTSDHGEQLRERGNFGHGGALWEYLIHVPLVIAMPGAAPRRVKTPASTLDVAPTLAALAGVQPDSSWTGRAHVAEITAGIDEPDRVVFAVAPAARVYAAITTGWKLLRDDYRNIYQLVDLGADKAESRDADDGAMRARLMDAMHAWRERVSGSELVH